MKKIIKIILVLFALILIAIVAIPFLVPLDTYRNQIIAQVKEKTGRDLTIAGDIKASIFPVIGVNIGKTSLSNAKGYTAINMVQVDGLSVEVSLGALLQKKLQIKQFILKKPLVNLEVNSNGEPNWEFSETVPTAKTETAEKTENASGAEALLAGLMLGDIKITDGEINYIDGKTKRNLAVTALNLKASLPSLTEKFSFDGDAMWNDQNVIIKALITNPKLIIDGSKSAFAFDLQAKPISIRYVGEVSQTSVNGKIDFNTPSISQLAKWAGSSFEWKGSAPLAFSMRGDLDASASDVALKDAEISLDNTKLKGNIKAKIDQKTPDIEVSLASDSLDITPYLKREPIKTSWLINSAIAAEFSNQIIELSGLNAVNAKAKLNLGNIIYDKIKLGKTLINADLNNGALKLNIPEMALYGGGAKINATLNSSGAFTKQVNVSSVNIGEFLGDLTANNRFTGIMNGSANLNGKLTSVHGMMQTLGGDGNIKITNGAIKGIDLKNMVNNIKSAFTNVDKSAQQTAFSELSGTFTIAQGILTNNDLSLKSELLTLSGKGKINLPMQTIQYRLNPEMASTVKRGDGSQTKGLEFPIIVEGSFENPRFIPDVEGIVKSTIENPAALRNTVKSLKDQIKNGKPDLNQVQDLLKGFGQ